MNLINILDKNKDLQSWMGGFSRAHRTLLTGLSGTAKSLVLANAFENVPDKYVIVTDSQFHAGELYEELGTLIGQEKVYQFFSDDNVYAEFALASKDRTAYRLEALNFLLDDEREGFLIVPVMALRSFLPDPKAFKEADIFLHQGEESDFERFIAQLAASGYERVDRVLSPGEFARRGDIVDVYPLDKENPVRLEFFGDEVDKIREFDAETQRSLQEIDRLRILPASDFILSQADYARAVKVLSSYVKEENTYLDELLATFKQGEAHSDLRKFLEYFYEQPATLWDYFSKSIQIFVDDFQKVNEADKKISVDLADFVLAEKQLERSIEGQQYLADTAERLRTYKPTTFISNFQKGLGNLRFDALYNFNQHSMQQFFGQMDVLVTELERFEKQGMTVVITDSTGKVRTALQEVDTSCQPEFTGLTLANGFVWLDLKLVVITEAEIFGKVRRKRAPRLNITNAERLKDYNELEIGDYVVHRTHGVGKYLGIQTIEISGQHRDYLVIEYQKGDTISVPIDHLNALTKYSAGEGKIPKINRLNDGRWRRTYSDATKQVEDISADLIKLYAARQSQKGFAFSADDESQEEFDAAFSYVETPDQLRSIEETKKDMEKVRPMDRLLVGDVGFGKTEVAMRAAFKAINDHKQVAVLVPTTVLAEQHYQTFSERFLEFGVNVAVLSRFQTKAEQAQILSKLAKGQIDLIVGTHRLLSKDVVFQDLGFMVIDEEQRFGVKHKERLKELKTQVDVLTLTATPIPRTLHMSMLGIRDLSVIETPPTNRYPVQTYVMEQNYGVIRDAVLREIGRNGQVFYVFNRVEGIETKVTQLEELIPEARIAAIHGRMSEVQLENTLIDFINGDNDVLVSTTIIETGVDIPNANTLIIENADKFGLSQLYQLRGRVGRTNRVAYAYFMYQPDKVLTEVADKRLEAIRGFTELGSGFKIAMRDLSIRGAGNLLGAEQSGFIDSIGFDLYSQLLEEAVASRMGKKEGPLRTNCEITLDLDAYLPTDYIADERQKIEIYKRIRQIDSREIYEDLKAELVDRFGKIPWQVADLLQIGFLKNLADVALLEKVAESRNEIVLTFARTALTAYKPEQFFEGLSVTGMKATVAEERGLMVIRLLTERKGADVWLPEVVKVVEKLAEMMENSKKKLDTLL